MKGSGIPGTTAGFVAAALILVAVGGLVVASARRYAADSEWVTHTYAVITQLENIRAMQRDAIIASAVTSSPATGVTAPAFSRTAPPFRCRSSASR